VDLFWNKIGMNIFGDRKWGGVNFKLNFFKKRGGGIKPWSVLARRGLFSMSKPKGGRGGWNYKAYVGKNSPYKKKKKRGSGTRIPNGGVETDGMEGSFRNSRGGVQDGGWEDVAKEISKGTRGKV